jgi:anthranilate phosphoribosyltransferase
VVLLNAAAVLVVAGVAQDLKDGCEGRESVDSKAALKKLDGLVRMTAGKGRRGDRGTKSDEPE